MATRQWLQADAEDAAMNYRGFTFPIWDSRQYRYLLRSAENRRQTCMVWMDNYRAELSHLAAAADVQPARQP
ncbi:hypothetical protein MJ699_06900 [Klebsiella pneumoniae]|nr:hypothetical protein MJ699_06900 [Klebsiella pneumoniae]